MANLRQLVRLTAASLAVAILTAASLLVAPGPLFGQEARSPVPLSLERMAAYVSDYRRSPVWPGYDLLGYSLVYLEGGDAYLLASATGSALIAQATPVPGLRGVLRLDAAAGKALASEHVFEERNFEGERVFVCNLIPEAKTSQTQDPIHEFLVLLHEVFHATFQNDSMYYVFGKGNERILGARDYAYIQVEASVLSRLLGERDTRRLRQGLRLYSALRKRHAKLVPDSLWRYRQGMEVTEGTAQYLADTFWRRVRPSGSGNKAAYTEAELRRALLEPLEADRSRYYEMGSAVCHLLDRVSADWKTRFVPPDASLDSILVASGLTPLSAAEYRRVSAAERLPAALDRHADRYLEEAGRQARELEEAKKRFRAEGSQRLVLLLPSLEEIAFGGTWSQSFDLPAGQDLTFARRTEAKWRVDGTSLLMLEGGFLKSWDSRSGKMTLELYRDLRLGDLIVDGQPLGGNRLPVSGRIAVERKGFELHAPAARVERRADGAIQITVYHR